jgi:hypothetical protein
MGGLLIFGAYSCLILFDQRVIGQSQFEYPCLLLKVWAVFFANVLDNYTNNSASTCN